MITFLLITSSFAQRGGGDKDKKGSTIILPGLLMSGSNIIAPGPGGFGGGFGDGFGGFGGFGGLVVANGKVIWGRKRR